MMPIMDGWEVTRLIRQKEQQETRSHVPIIAWTALLTESDHEDFIKAGLDYTMPKPVHIKDLQDRLERFLTH